MIAAARQTVTGQARSIGLYDVIVRNPGYVHELASIYLTGGRDIVETADKTGIDRADFDRAVEILKPLSSAQRQEEIHRLYVTDARDKGFAYGDPEKETTWVLGQRANSYYNAP